MTSASATSRREFLVLASLSGAALVLQSCRSPLPPDATGATGATAAAGAFRPDLWLSILPDGSVEFAVTRLEMGQGIRTGLTILVAEELAMAPERIRLRSPTTAELPEAGVILETGSSDSTSDHWVPLREAAAAAREMLVAAAAARWQVEPGACALADGRVVLREGARDVRGVRGVRSIGIGELAAEAARLPVPKRPTPRGPSEFRFIGKPTRRLEGPEIVTGKPRFAADVRLENQLYAVLSRPPVTGGRARAFDPAPALAVPGVRRVVAVDAAWAVVADDTWSALRGREALAIEWENGPAAEFSSAAFGRGLDEALTVEMSAGAYQPPVGEQARAIVVTPGSADLRAMPAATPTLEARYSTGFQTHMPMEPLNATARCEGDRCEIWVGHQKPHEVVAAVAGRLDLAPDRIVVHPLPMGGGFGGREQAAFAVEAAVLARELRGTPVQVFWTRADDLRHSTYHPASRHLLQGWLDAKGRLAAWRHRVASPSIEIQWGRSFHSVGKAEATGAWNLPYTCANVRVEYADLRVPVPLGFWRGVEIMFNNFAVECFIDELALQAGRDPLEFRLAHLGEAVRSLGTRHKYFYLDRLRGVLELAAARGDWRTPLAPGRGRGIAGLVFDGRTAAATVAEVTVSDGELTVDRIVCAIDCGIVVNPLGLENNAEGAIAWGLSALYSEITFDRGQVVESSHLDYPTLRLPQMPAVEIHLVASDLPPSGTGEIPTPTVAPAVLNAICQATGRRLRRLPLRAGDLT